QNVLLGFLLDALHLDVGLLQAGCGDRLLRTLLLGHVAASPARTRLLDRLLGGAFRADGGDLGQIVEAGAAGDADALGAEFRLRHPVASRALPAPVGAARERAGAHATAACRCQLRRAASIKGGAELFT